MHVGNDYDARAYEALLLIVWNILGMHKSDYPNIDQNAILLSSRIRSVLQTVDCQCPATNNLFARFLFQCVCVTIFFSSVQRNLLPLSTTMISSV